MKILLSALGVALTLEMLSSCQTAQPRVESIETKLQYASLSKSNLGLSLTKRGENEQGSFSPDNQSIVFVSKGRRHHSHTQVYILSLDNFKEQRVTYSDGDVEHPIFSSQGEAVLYASNTDELKERPSLFYQFDPKMMPPNDLYESDLSGLQIQRLTNLEGYQGQVSAVSGKPNEYSYLSQTKTNTLIQVLSLPKKNSRTLLRIPISASESKKINSPIFSSANLLLWIEEDLVTHLGIIQSKRSTGSGGSVKTVPLPPATYNGLSWWDADKEMLLFSAKFVSPNENNGIYIYNLKENCLISLLQDSVLLLDPRVSYDKKKLLFTAVEDGKRQLFLKSTPDPLPVCRKGQ